MTSVTPLLPDPGATLDLDGEDLRRWLGDRYALEGPHRVRLNLVTAIGGQITGPGGTSDDLTGGIDRVLLGVLRSSADAVLVGAGTLRRERLGLPRAAVLAVATRGALVAADLPDPRDGRRAVVLAPSGETDRLARELGERADVHAADGPTGLVRALADAGLGRIVCEGGGRLASALLAAGVVDELDHTLAPLLLAPGEPMLSGRFAPVTGRLDGLLRDGTDRLYLRWRLPRRG